MSASQNVVALSPSKQRRPSALDPAFRVWCRQQDDAARGAGLSYASRDDLVRQYQQLIDERAARQAASNVVRLEAARRILRTQQSMADEFEIELGAGLR